MKRILSVVLVLVAVSAGLAQNASRYVTAKYDKFEDRSVVSLWEMPLGQGAIGQLPKPWGMTRDSLTLTLLYNHTSQKPHVTLRPDDEMYVRVTTNGVMGLVSPPSLVLLIDGERLTIETKWLSSREVDEKSVLLRVDYSLLQRLARAKTVEGKLGITEFHLSQSHQSEIREFIRKINP